VPLAVSAIGLFLKYLYRVLFKDRPHRRLPMVFCVMADAGRNAIVLIAASRRSRAW
jgi:hypothetical protein